MKKLYIIATLLVALSSCQKEVSMPQETAKPVYFKVEAVEKNGQVSSSNIIVVK